MVTAEPSAVTIHVLGVLRDGLASALPVHRTALQTARSDVSGTHSMASKPSHRAHSQKGAPAMDLNPRPLFARLRRMSRGRPVVLIRRVLAVALLVMAAVAAMRPSSPGASPPAAAKAGADVPLMGGPGFSTVPVHLADASVAALLSRGMRVDVVAVDSTEQRRKVLASMATVVDVRSPPEGSAGLLGAGSKGPLVLISVPAELATEVAALSLRNPVAVTLR